MQGLRPNLPIKHFEKIGATLESGPCHLLLPLRWLLVRRLGFWEKAGGAAKTCLHQPSRHIRMTIVFTFSRLLLGGLETRRIESRCDLFFKHVHCVLGLFLGRFAFLCVLYRMPRLVRRRPGTTERKGLLPHDCLFLLAGACSELT